MSQQPGYDRSKDLLLLIDDEPDLLETMAETLAGADREIITAGGPEAAHRFLSEHAHEVALVLCDITMPGQTGLEVIRQCQAEVGYFPAVMVTARMETQYPIEALRLGVLDYLAKPFRFDELSEKVNFWIELGRRERMLRESKLARFSTKMELLFRQKMHALAARRKKAA
jgi:DNA-binding NtrC family response regulator